MRRKPVTKIVTVLTEIKAKQASVKQHLAYMLCCGPIPTFLCGTLCVDFVENLLKSANIIQNLQTTKSMIPNS